MLIYALGVRQGGAVSLLENYGGFIELRLSDLITGFGPGKCRIAENLVWWIEIWS